MTVKTIGELPKLASRDDSIKQRITTLLQNLSEDWRERNRYRRTGRRTYRCHRDERHFPAPERFDPDRFTAEARKGRSPFAFFPFGGGPHLCIGESVARMEAVLAIASIAQRFDFELLSDQPVLPVPGLTLKPNGPIRMRLLAR